MQPHNAVSARLAGSYGGSARLKGRGHFRLRHTRLFWAAREVLKPIHQGTAAHYAPNQGLDVVPSIEEDVQLRGTLLLSCTFYVQSGAFRVNLTWAYYRSRTSCCVILIFGFEHLSCYQTFLAWLTFRPGLEVGPSGGVSTV